MRINRFFPCSDMGSASKKNHTGLFGEGHRFWNRNSMLRCVTTMLIVFQHNISPVISSREPERPLAAWMGSDRINDAVMPALTVILKTGGCEWNRCRMCSYRHERYENRDSAFLESRIIAQISWIQDHFRLEDVDAVKIYTSGSLFDASEVPPRVLEALARLLSGKLVIAETRPEFVREEDLSLFISAIDDGTHDTPLYVAMGVETSSDSVREKCINKGFTWNDFLRACTTARSAGAGVKAYLLAKPLFLTEREAIMDIRTSVNDLTGLADLISLNPCTVQKGTELEYYWKQRAYRPPYLWSILAMLSDSPVHMTCDPLGGGHARGTHNCGVCDRPLVKGIRDYSLSADRGLLKTLLDAQCPCKEEWEFVVREERPYCMPLTH